ncbi:MAG: leucyl/phenylalanyl-tRNA--protein transferase [Planctomycetota bacterium]|nr:leucyl/phenylalanyl-tRNA--protein transferase [Planctomycetota bacterium]
MNDLVGLTRDLDLRLVEAAYRQGIFPMGAAEVQAVTWHRPDPRAIIPLDGFHVSRSLRKTLRQGRFETTCDRAFLEVMRGCAEREPTWITADFYRVYGELHREGKAHSVEVWHAGRLVGGTYGVQMGAAFCAESKFHRMTDASKVALAGLVARLKERGFELLEVQYLTPHLERFGAVEISLAEYLKRLAKAGKKTCRFA